MIRTSLRHTPLRRGTTRLRPISGISETYVAFFWSKVGLRMGSQSECWPWLARIGFGGYGRFSYFVAGEPRTSLAHRVSYAIFIGDPGELNVLHACDNRVCVRPSHLRLGTQQQNLSEMAAKGRGARGPGLYGARRNSVNTWSAHVKHRGRSHYLGNFPSPEEAHRVAVAFRKATLLHVVAGTPAEVVAGWDALAAGEREAAS